MINYLKIIRKYPATTGSSIGIICYLIGLLMGHPMIIGISLIAIIALIEFYFIEKYKEEL